MDQSNERGFTGVWIPAEVWDHPDLKIIDRILWAEISALAAGAKQRLGKPGCFCSNAVFAQKYGLSEEYIRKRIYFLKKTGFVREVGFDGRHRYLDVVVQVFNLQSESAGNAHPDRDSGPTQHGTRVPPSGSPLISGKRRLKNTPSGPATQSGLSPMKDPVATGYQEAFALVHPVHMWKSVPQERRALNDLARLTRLMAGGEKMEPDDLARALLKCYDQMRRTERGSYWSDAPFIASAMYARWNQIVERLRSAPVETVTQDDIEDLARRMREAMGS